MTAPATSPAEPAARRLAVAALAVSMVAVAFSPLFVRLSDAGPTASAFWRVALALPLLWLWLRAGGPPAARRPLSRRDWTGLLLSGVFFTGDLAMWHLAIRNTSIANASLLANLSPIFVTLACWLLFRERFTRAFLGGLAAALAGVALLMGENLGSGRSHPLGDLLSVLTAMFYAGYIVVVGRLRARLPSATIMLWTAVVTALMLAPLALLLGERLFPVSLEGWLILIGLAWITHAAGQGLIAFALAHLPASLLAVSLLVQPALAALIAWAVLGEGLGPWQAAGGIVILAGIVLAQRGSRLPAG